MVGLPLQDRFVVLGVTGGIAAYKAVDVCRRLVDLGAHVAPVLTEEGMHLFEIRDDQIVSSSDYWDASTFSRQMATTG